MNKIAFIIPYFGHFNNYFEIFLRSCEMNKNYCDWLIFTDDKTNYSYPSNVKVTLISWNEMKELIERKLGFSISQPYKLCDYKPTYGYLFEKYLETYLFWGHCDTDLVWGDIEKFLKPKILNKYDKIFDLGHCTLYRNNDKMNKLFMECLDGKKRYTEVYNSVDNVSFDEEYNRSINNICLEQNIKLYTNSFAANTYMKTSNFRLTYLSKDKHSYWTEKKYKSFFVWNNGSLFRYIFKNNKWTKEEYMYIHFQSRKMKNNIQNPYKATLIKIIPNSFDNLEVSNINMDNIDNIKTKHINLHYFRLRLKNLLIKARRFLSEK